MSRPAFPASTRPSSETNRAAIIWGIGLGSIQAATPLVFWWLDSSTVYALGLAAIAAIYVGFAVSDGRRRIIAVESGVAFAFVLVAAAAVTGTPWLLVAGFIGHGVKDLWHTGTVKAHVTRVLMKLELDNRDRVRGQHPRRVTAGESIGSPA